MAKGTKQQDLPPELLAWLFDDGDADPKTNITKNEG